ncbi:MAG: PBP1A family penicillin-binding protein [Acidobacteriia bacterium]|nr:PBP1A family penicillin-binding protein [Terriglobia bacterium]
MAIKIKIPRVKGFRGSLRNPFFRAGLAAFLIISLLLFGVFSYYYIKYQKIVDARMSKPIFANTAKIYAQPRSIRIGQKADPREIANYLRHAGYTESGEQGKSKFGVYKVMKDAIEIKPGEESYYSAEGAVVRIKDGHVDKIASLAGSDDSLTAYEIEPQLVTGLFDGQARSKRRLVKYEDIPKVMVDAVTSIEDRRFFHHNGVNYWRLLQAGWIDLRQGGNRQGGSTITMQVARGFFLSPEKKLKRKLTEILISIELEQRFSKKQIFELYANQVDMGQRGSFTITGFGEAAQAYFSKDLKDLSLPEAAMLAGLVQRPSYLSPYRHPERAQDRRNLVLEAMVDTGSITRAQADVAKATPLKLAPQNVEASDAPYFVDLIREQLVSKYGEDDLNADGFRIYTTLDPALQQAAAQAVDIGLKEVDAQVAKLRTKRVKVGKNKFETKVMPGPIPQVALIALDPHTGEVLALVGGRNYGFSQLNHAVAKRPTGSIFKPFVYAAAINNAVTNEQPIFTPASLVDDSPTAFINGDDVYTPRNYKEEYHGQVTAQFALAHSLNNATVKVAEMVGYDKVANLAKIAGIASVRATPAMALGSYDATPMEMASAYTIFTNNGQRITPTMVRSVRDANGDIIDNFQPQKSQVLDPRVSYVITDMMQGVINNGTAAGPAGVRARKFMAPAAGKTGSSHDGWFAGFTSNLLCIVWVGYDDYSDIHLSGAVIALPIWTEFMKRAVDLPNYSDVKPFAPPQGVVELTLDRATNQIATAACPDDYTTAFIDGTQPTQTCEQSSHGNVFQRIFGIDPKPTPTPPASATSNGNSGSTAPSAAQVPVPQNSTQSQPQEQEKKKKGFWGKIFGGSKDDNKDDNKQNKPAVAPSPGKDRPH